MPFVSHSPFCPALLFTIITISKQNKAFFTNWSYDGFFYYIVYKLLFPKLTFWLCIYMVFSAMDKVLSPRSSAYVLANIDPHLGFSSYDCSPISEKKVQKLFLGAAPYTVTIQYYLLWVNVCTVLYCWPQGVDSSNVISIVIPLLLIRTVRILSTTDPKPHQTGDPIASRSCWQEHSPKLASHQQTLSVMFDGVVRQARSTVLHPSVPPHSVRHLKKNWLLIAVGDAN